MLHLCRQTLFATLIAATLPLSAYAGGHDANAPKWSRSHSHEIERGDDHFVLRVALWGDEFYADDPTQKATDIEQTIDSMNQHDLDFTIFAGDTKNGSSECTDYAIGDAVADIFDSLDAPTLYSLGDNEWTDCHRTSNGSYDPLERLAYLRDYFFSKPVSQGRHPLRVERQGELGKAYSENSRFVMNNVEFVALHVPGSNNNLVVTDSQCYKKSDRTWNDCMAASEEYRLRNAQNIAWLRESFQKARDNGYAGVLVVIQADVFFPFELSDGGYADDFLPQLDENNGYSDFFHTLEAETHNYDGQVLLVHGDSHYFKLDKAMVDADGRQTPNFTRVEVFGSADNSWIEMTVDPSTQSVFSFKPVVLP